MSHVRIATSLVVALGAWVSVVASPQTDAIVLENASFRLEVGADAAVRSLVVKATGEECLAKAEPLPLFAAMQDRPFNNEIKLIYPNKRTTYSATSLRREDDTLIAGFAHRMYEAKVRVKVAPSYMAFELVDFICDRKRTYGNRKMDIPPVASFRVLQLPVANRKNFGDWLNASWDENAAVGVVGTSQYPDIDHENRRGFKVLTADLVRGRKLRGAGAAIIASPGREAFLDAMDALEADCGLPRGVKSRRSPVVNRSIFHTDGFRNSAPVTPENIDELLPYLKAGGFNLLTFSYGDVVKTEWSWALCGNYDFRPEYPEGEKSLREMLAKVKAAGITPGLHTLHSHIGMKSRYVTPVADPRLNKTRRFTLAKPLVADTNATELTVLESTEDATMFAACRVLQFGGELLSYESYTTEPPYRFLGVRRGAWNTKVTAHPAGEIGGILDISEYGVPSSCYIDQDTDLQDEVAAKIARLYSCGFEYVYLDGSEGVNAPFNYNVAKGQYRYWRLLKPEPLFGEGAAKTHFGWHMLSGANAFDVFMPEEFKEKLIEYPFAQAPIVWQEMTRCNFGWWQFYPPNHGAGQMATIGTQADMWEFGQSVSVAWRCPMTVQANLEGLKKHPRTADILETMRRWEEFREKDLMTDAERREILSDYRQEHHLVKLANGAYRIVRYEQIPVGAKDVRAFLFEADGCRWVVYWHGCGSSTLRLSVPADSIALFDEFAGNPVKIGKSDGSVTIPAAARAYLRTTLSIDAIKKAFAAASSANDVEALFLVASNGVPKADIVIPAKPLDAVRYAADELKYHLDKAFGADFKIVAEDACAGGGMQFHFFLGETKAAKAAGIPGRELKPDERYLKRKGNGLYLVGCDSGISRSAIPDIQTVRSLGTLYAVYDFLETELKVMWIWPGEMGEIIPKRSSLEIGVIERGGIEPFDERYFWGTFRGEPIGFSCRQAYERFFAAQTKFLVRHRLGRRLNTVSGHSFGDWWKRFGKEHPEYFNLLPDGTRRPLHKPSLVTMCCSEPGVWKQKAADWNDWWQKTGKPGGYEPWVNCCENDSAGLCTCAKCRAWDPPDPRFGLHPYWKGGLTREFLDSLWKEKGPNHGEWALSWFVGDNRWDIPEKDSNLKPVAPLSDRYANFYNHIQAEVARYEPRARVVGYAYENYVEAPQMTKVDPRVIIEYVPRSYLPYDKTESEFFRKHWMGWKKAGVKYFRYRPNYMLACGGYHLDQGRLILSDFAFAYTNGMRSCMFDSLRGSWAAHTLMDYALIRAMRDPLHGYDRARSELLSAFGKAHREVAAFFDGIRAHSEHWTFADIRKMSWANHTGAQGGGSFGNCAAILGEYFDDRFFADGYATLDRAERAADGDAAVIARIGFLRKGLRNVELTRAVRIAQTDWQKSGGDEGKKAVFDAAFKAMNDYRASVEADFVCNFSDSARNERNGMQWPHRVIGQ